MLINLPPAVARALTLAAFQGEPGSAAYQAAELLEELIPRGARQLEGQELEDQALEELSQGRLAPGPAELRLAGGWSRPAELDFAVDTVRQVRQSGLGPAECVDLDRIIDLLYAIRG